MHKMILAVLICFSAAGCTTTKYYTSDSEIFAANGSKAKLHVTRTSAIDAAWTNYHWTTGGVFAKKYDLADVKEKYSPYLETSYKSDISDIRGYDAVEKEYESFFNYALKESSKLNGLTGEVDKRHQIICLDPLVVLVLDRKTVAWDCLIHYFRVDFEDQNGKEATRRCIKGLINRNRVKQKGLNKNFTKCVDFGGPWLPGRSDNYRSTESFTVLPGGVHHGVVFPYSAKPRWFSPDMKVKDQTVEMISDTKGQIQVPWGYLYLTKQNDNWVVTAENK